MGGMGSLRLMMGRGVWRFQGDKGEEKGPVGQRQRMSPVRNDRVLGWQWGEAMSSQAEDREELGISSLSKK